jgi:hypothetical protein
MLAMHTGYECVVEKFDENSKNPSKPFQLELLLRRYPSRNSYSGSELTPKLTCKGINMNVREAPVIIGALG